MNVFLIKKSPKVWELTFEDVVVERSSRLMDNEKALVWAKKVLDGINFFKNNYKLEIKEIL